MVVRLLYTIPILFSKFETRFGLGIPQHTYTTMMETETRTLITPREKFQELIKLAEDGKNMDSIVTLCTNLFDTREAVTHWFQDRCLTRHLTAVLARCPDPMPGSDLYGAVELPLPPADGHNIEALLKQLKQDELEVTLTCAMRYTQLAQEFEQRAQGAHMDHRQRALLFADMCEEHDVKEVDDRDMFAGFIPVASLARPPL
jgi:hypothetical protein